jgi:DNA-directed RNA polymerase subunit RPC12/RpoP
VCPRCHGRLLMGPRERNERVTTREVHCTNCRHSVAIVQED